MTNLLEKTLRHYPHSVITAAELACLLGGTPDSRYGRVKRAIQKGDLIRVKRGLYTINPEVNGRLPDLFEVAQRLHTPSFVSTHSALSYYDLIPEAVYLTTAATTTKTKKIETPHGAFKYERMPAKAFYTDVQTINSEHVSFTIANPWRALLDLMYLHSKTYTSIDELEEDLRIDIDELPPISPATLNQLKNYYHSEAISNFIDNIPKEFKK